MPQSPEQLSKLEIVAPTRHLPDILSQLGKIAGDFEDVTIKLIGDHPHPLSDEEPPQYNPQLVTLARLSDDADPVPFIAKNRISEIERQARGQIGLTQRIFSSLSPRFVSSGDTLPFKDYCVFSSDSKRVIGLRADRLETLCDILKDPNLRPRSFGDSCFEVLKNVERQLYTTATEQ